MGSMAPSDVFVLVPPSGVADAPHGRQHRNAATMRRLDAACLSAARPISSAQCPESDARGSAGGWPHGIRVQHLHGLVAHAHHQHALARGAIDDTGIGIKAGEHADDAPVLVLGIKARELGQLVQQLVDVSRLQAELGSR